jgi:hypothetical protein
VTRTAERIALALTAAMFVAVALLVWQSLRSPQTETAECTTAECEQEYSFAILGDYPYTDAQLEELPQVATQVNADPEVSMVVHLGDIKSHGECSTSYYQNIKNWFHSFQDPLVYTFGDNEWTECYRPDEGRRYQPLERLDTLRAIFVPEPGKTLGRDMTVQSQADSGYPENVQFIQAEVSFGAFHTVGPRNGLFSWTGAGGPTAEQRREVSGRTDAAVELIQATFQTAREQDLRAVVLLTQADMFSPLSNSAADHTPYRSIVQTIAEETQRFGRPVYLFNGDTHEYVSEQPLVRQSKWRDIYDVPTVENLTRITIDGDTNLTNYLKVTIRPHFSKVLLYDRVRFATR